MPKIAYVRMNLGDKKLAVIEQANEIIAEYAAQGFDLTLRQLYYQFVARGLLPNKQIEYKRLGDAINDGRMSGLIDWNRIVDRTRYLRSTPHWTNPADIVETAAKQFRHDKWKGQTYRIEVWVEKDALVGVMEQACTPLDVPFFACRGYTSQSEMWAAAMRLKQYVGYGQKVKILHFGDHDPSGIDMSRDIEDRIRLFMGTHSRSFSFERLALNEEQVETYSPPPNPAKLTDSRAQGYIARFGDESWELDALEPTVLVGLVTAAVEAYRDERAWREAVEAEKADRARLRAASERWTEVADLVGEGTPEEEDEETDEDEETE